MPIDLVLTVEYPSLNRRRTKGGRTVYDDAHRRINTRVRKVRLYRIEGVLVDDQVKVEAYIPPLHRGNVFAHHSRWVTPEYLACFAWIGDNKKTLAAFLASGDEEWDLREAQ